MDACEALRLRDGRSIDVRVSGPIGGVPLVFHHGTPGARLPFRSLERAAHERGLRFVTFSRPGYGTSSRRAGRRVVDVVEDTAAVLDWLGTERCLVGGWSGGVPHALACAARLSATLGVLLIAGVAPFDAEGLDWVAGMGEQNITEFAATEQGEASLRSYLEGVRAHLQEVTVEGIITAFGSLLPEVDLAVLTDEFAQDMVHSFREALRVDVEGWLDDDLAFVKPWGFSLAEVAAPTAIWHGSADCMVPFAHGQWLAAHVPGATAHLEEGEGHLSVAVGAIDAMFDELLRLAPGASSDR